MSNGSKPPGWKPGDPEPEHEPKDKPKPDEPEPEKDWTSDPPYKPPHP
jgi:hypothetical protein